MKETSQRFSQQWVGRFADLTEMKERKLAGGKGGTLAQLFQVGYPVPAGFVVFHHSFLEDELRLEAWTQIEGYLQTMRKARPGIRFAVRSSALSEDSIQASFAGEFESLLDLECDEEVRSAIEKVHSSRKSERVSAYSQAQGIVPEHEMAVVVQELVKADLSGVLFTSDPVTGSYSRMIGNFVFGLGEKLVSGEADAHSFNLARPKGKYTGPVAVKRYARRLYKMAERLENDLGCPQDIEWAVSGGKVYLLQSRPITTLARNNPLTGEWNDSLGGDYLWSNCNFTEAVPDVMTPLTYSLWKVFHEDTALLTGVHPNMGNICGRPYANVTLAVSLLGLFGKDAKTVLREYEGTFGMIPEDMEVPVIPFPKVPTFLKVLSESLKRRKLAGKMIPEVPEFIESTPAWCERTKARINQVTTHAALLKLWVEEIFPYFIRTCWMLRFSAMVSVERSMQVLHELTELAGEEDANALLLHLDRNVDLEADTGYLASLGPMVNLIKVARGEMSRERYLELFGHRGPEECELISAPPSEDPGWLDQQLVQYKDTEIDLEGLFERRRAEYDAAWKRFVEKYPSKSEKIQSKLSSVTEAARRREAVRSEVVRVFGVIRSFVLRTGEITGLGKKIFFLYREELLDLLSGDESVCGTLEARMDTYERYQSLPPYPGIIRGCFDPFLWVKDPQRRNDIFDSRTAREYSEGDLITGFPGSAGRVEGVVRRMDRIEESDAFQDREVLVTSTTNVGWTPLFPRAAAIVTDVGAPLSHAAIVARELGIPAVVGCGNATMRLKTGDKVMVDGGRGVVEVLRNTKDQTVDHFSG